MTLRESFKSAEKWYALLGTLGCLQDVFCGAPSSNPAPHARILGTELVLERHAKEGECEEECQTMARACQQVRAWLLLKLGV